MVMRLDDATSSSRAWSQASLERGTYKIHPSVRTSNRLDPIWPLATRTQYKAHRISYQNDLYDTNMDHLDVDKKKVFEHHEGGSIDQEEVINYVPGTAEEKALLRKVDKRLLPILWLMYIFNYIDRTNIGVSLDLWSLWLASPVVAVGG